MVSYAFNLSTWGGYKNKIHKVKLGLGEEVKEPALETQEPQSKYQNPSETASQSGIVL